MPEASELDDPRLHHYSTPPEPSIKLVCLHCKRSMNYDRAIDPGIPREVMKITQPHCDQCWNGDREGETWYDAKGREVCQNAAVQS